MMMQRNDAGRKEAGPVQEEPVTEGKQREMLEHAVDDLRRYREKSLCGYCREYADITIDTLQAMQDIDRNVEMAVRTKLEHPGYLKMPELNGTMHRLKVRSEEMLTPPARAPAAAPAMQSQGGPLRQLGRNGGPLGMRPMATDTKNNFMGIIDSVRPVNIFNGWRQSGVGRRIPANKGSQ